MNSYNVLQEFCPAFKEFLSFLFKIFRPPTLHKTFQHMFMTQVQGCLGKMVLTKECIYGTKKETAV